MEKQKNPLIDEALRLVSQMRPDLKATRDLCDCGGGFVEESVFSFSKNCCLWVVILCNTGQFAFKEITPDWIKTYSNLILSSPEVFVEFDINHKICAWAVEQDKICVEEGQSLVKKTRPV
ncbi:MAG: hypothetical protein ACOY46_15785 [Bacillota bacterium]